SYIDGQNQDEETKDKISDLVKSDDKIFKKYKSELLTKQYLKSKLQYSEVPDETRLRIIGSINNLIYPSAQKNKVKTLEAERVLPAQSFIDYLKNLLITPIRIKGFSVPRYAFAVVLLFTVVFIAVLVTRNQAPQNHFLSLSSDNRVIMQALNNFHRIMSGDFKPQMESENAKEVSGFLQEKASFKSYIPSISDYELNGCDWSEFNGRKLVHLFYTSGDDVIYIYQTEVSSLKDKKLEIPEIVHDKILKEKFYLCDNPNENNCALILWYTDNVLCAAVSNIPKQNLFNKFIGIK
ncbi:MAG: hypothetical protein ACRDFC_02505, partial [Ignavibacteria bacterium]